MQSRALVRNPFLNYCSKTAVELFRLLEKYRPESKQAKRARLRKRAADLAAGKPDVPTKRQNWVRQGINTVTTLVEQKKAKLVVIASDVEPIEVSYVHLMPYRLR